MDLLRAVGKNQYLLLQVMWVCSTIN